MVDIPIHSIINKANHTHYWCLSTSNTTYTVVIGRLVWYIKSYKTGCYTPDVEHVHSLKSSSIFRNVLRGHAGLNRLSKLNSLTRSRIVNPCYT